MSILNDVKFFLGVVYVWQNSIDGMYTSSLRNMLRSATPFQNLATQPQKTMDIRRPSGWNLREYGHSINKYHFVPLWLESILSAMIKLIYICTMPFWDSHVKAIQTCVK